DQTVKQKLYAKAGIPEYWIINISEEQLEVYKAPIGDEYATKEVIKKGEELVLKILDYDFDLAVLFS
ncbi:MAG: Uma2 family endonuclease, partial [Bacteroidota bacterium]